MKLERLEGESDEAYAERQRIEDARHMSRVGDTSRILGTVYRAIELSRDAIISEDERLVRVSFSSEKPVLRASWFERPWVEVLGHNAGEMNTGRLDNGASVHYNHSRSRADRVGVVESGSIKEQRGEAILRFSKNERVNDIWDDVKDNILRNVSVGYSIDERVLTREGGKGEPDEYRVTRWTPHEISFVDIPADHTVGLGRNVEAGFMVRGEGGSDPVYRIESISTPNIHLSGDPQTMKLERYEGETDEKLAARQKIEDDRVEAERVEAARIAAEATNTPPTELEAARIKAHKEGVTAGTEAEQTRRTEIETIFAPFEKQLGDKFADTRKHCLDDQALTVEASREYLLTEIGKGQTPVGGDPHDVRVIETDVDAFTRGAGASILLRAGLIDQTSEEGRAILKDSIAGWSMREIARRYVELSGESTLRMLPMEMVGRAFSTSDFPLLLQDAANKSMLKGFEEAPETWMDWAQTGNLSDFKIGNRPGLSSFDDLQLVSENGEFVYGQFTEQRNTIQLATYGKLFAITRQAIINDDLSAFTVIPQRMGRASSRLVGDLAYGVITANGVLGDGIALFAAAHNNLNESGGGGTPLTADAAGTAAFAAMRNAMALQTDASNSATGLNIRPAHFLVPVVLEDVANTLMQDTTAPGQANPGQSNRIRGQAAVTSDPRLDTDSATRYYLSASAQFDTIEVAFLDGVQAPTLEQQMGWSVDGTEYKVRIDVGVAAMEFRTWQRDDGT